MANGINICVFCFRCLTRKKISRDLKKKELKTQNRREHQRDEKRAEKAAMKREKYVKINWKSIECDVKIKFIRAATSDRHGNLFLGLAGTYAIVYGHEL